MLSATASLGLILLWDVESGLTEIDKYLYSPEDYIKVTDSTLLLYDSGDVYMCLLLKGRGFVSMWYC